MSQRGEWPRETVALERKLAGVAESHDMGVLTLAREIRASTDDHALLAQLDQIIAVRSLVHLGESEERCSNLCDEESAHDFSNIDLDRVTWTDDGSWIDDVNCVECLRLAIKIGSDAQRRLDALVAPTQDEPSDSTAASNDD